MAIANILHSQEYSSHSSTPLNFDVRLLPKRGNKGGQGHSGKGALTLPTEALGTQFLRDYGGINPPKVLKIMSRQLRFEKSTRVVQLNIVETIRRRPYLDPKVLEEREKRAAELRANSISVRAIQFGWECRDSVFSVEWEKDCIDECGIFFEDDRRELRIKYFVPTETRIIAVRFSTINWTACSLFVRGQPTVFLSLHSPPSFESEATPEEFDSPELIMDSIRSAYDIRLRRRLSAFDVEHALVAPYTSLAIRLICSTERDVMLFRRLSRVAQLYEPQDFDYPVERRGLFSARNLDMLKAWLRKLDFEVAFQVEALTRALSVDVQEMLDLRTHIDDLVKHANCFGVIMI